MKKFLSQFSQPRLRRWALRGAAVLALVGISLGLGAARRGLLGRSDQQAAQSWSGDGTRFAQLSLFLAPGSALSSDGIREKRSALDTALTEASIKPANDTARLWLDAYSCSYTGSASAGNASAKVNITAVGGDFFFFHPQRFLYGGGFAESDEQHDTAVLDELAAWQLFGSSDVVGRDLTVNGKDYLICGVAAAKLGAADKLTYGELPRLWLSYDSVHIGTDTAVTCYEAVLPDPYTGYAKNLLKTGFGTADLDCTVTENSARHRLGALWNTLRSLPRAGMRSSGAAYPYWENAEQYNLGRAAVLLGLQVLCLIYPVLAAAVLLVLCWRRRHWHLRDLRAALVRRHERRLQAAWDASQHVDALEDPAGEIGETGETDGSPEESAGGPAGPGAPAPQNAEQHNDLEEPK